MHIVVCIKYIADPEAAFSMFRIDADSKKVIPASGLKHVVSPFDEQAIEAALRIREQHADTRITVLTLGVGLLLCTANVFYRDVRVLVEVLGQNR